MWYIICEQKIELPFHFIQAHGGFFNEKMHNAPMIKIIEIKLQRADNDYQQLAFRNHKKDKSCIRPFMA